MKAALLCALFVVTSPCTTAHAQQTRVGVLAVDEQQRAMVARGDSAGLERLAHRNLLINAPGGHVLDRDHFLANMRNGEIAAEGFERTAEEVKITGDIAVVMGHETFTPVATSELGRTFGAKPLNRRYTNVYIWEQGRWLWLARQANVVMPPNK